MTSAELIELIKQADPKGNRQVILQRDAEGNGYEPLYGVAKRAMNKRGDVGYESLTAAQRAEGYSDEDIVKGEKVLVLQP